MRSAELGEFKIVVTPKGARAVVPEMPTFELRQIMWNDAGFMTTYDVNLRVPGEKLVEVGYAKIMRLGLLEQEFALAPGEVDRLSSEHCALGQSFTYYERLAELENSLGSQFLRRIRDVVVSPSRLRRFKSSDLFKLSLIREGRAVRAMEDAPKLFDVKGARQSSKLPRQFRASIPLGDTPVNLRLDFRDLSAGAPCRVAALVGDNGTGKSAILRSLAASAVQANDKERKDSAIQTMDDDPVAVDFARVITISYGAFDEHSILREESVREQDSESGTATPASSIPRYFYRGLRSWGSTGESRLKSTHEIEDELWQALTSITDERRYKAFLDAVALLRGATDFPSDVLKELLAKSPTRIALTHLSSGQMIVLNVLVSLIAYLEPGSLVLIDEPEVHLHPPLTSALMRGIATSLAIFESVAIVATHSSVVVQELPSRNVRVLRRIENQTIVRPPEIETYGESLSAIDRHVFGLAGVPTNYMKVLHQLDTAPTIAAAERQLGIPLSTQATALWLQLHDGSDSN
jgi:predicted ATPase